MHIGGEHVQGYDATSFVGGLPMFYRNLAYIFTVKWMQLLPMKWW
jgi:hypothetical protein